MAKIPLAYTFGNHMHWVDMQWLWGYDVLPGCIDDMLAYCKQAGVKGNINFDGIGFEKMAAECPEHLAKLKDAIRQGIVEIVGGSYGQPYGLFQGGESNVRQRVYGVRTAMRLLGVRPRTFWEEEFDFYPQLPQMLAGCGFTGASLYFQWTWHTPEIPMEDAPVVAWEGIDGTQVSTATRNRMNLHQWPEDFRILLNELAANPPSREAGTPSPLVLQWLELMPTPDWMCRSELMLPMLAELKADPRFEVLATTLGDYLAQWTGHELPVRRYAMDDVWHGMTLGKNGDNHPKRSAELEHMILGQETAAAVLGLFGRPYEPWDVYPTWELEECWRLLLAAQHHDNHECEGLCGHVAEAQFAFIAELLRRSDSAKRLANRVETGQKEKVVFNHVGWRVKDLGLTIPAMGYTVGQISTDLRTWTVDGDIASFAADEFSVKVDIRTQTILELCTPSGRIENIRPVLLMPGEDLNLSENPPTIEDNDLTFGHGRGHFISLTFSPKPELGALEITVHLSAKLKPGYADSARIVWPELGPDVDIKADGPYAVNVVGNGSTGKRKYPEGDWMTSPQWFESVTGAFTSQSFVNFTRPDGTGLLLAHSGSQQWFRTDDGFANVLLANDPWDGNVRRDRASVTYHLYPHQSLTNAECLRRSAHLRRCHPFGGASFLRVLPGSVTPPAESPPLPRDFSAVTVHAPNVLATAFYREQASFSGRGLDTYAGEGITHPYILRLVEVNGEPADVELTLPGPIAKAYRTNLMGETIDELEVHPGEDRLLTTEPEKLAAFGIQAATIKLAMRPHEIATLYLDIVPGRKRFRDLDAKREIWATVHRTED